MEENLEDPLWQEAEGVFVEWLLEHKSPSRVPFDRLCAQHPWLALPLRRLKEQDFAMQSLAQQTGAFGGGLKDSSDGKNRQTQSGGDDHGGRSPSEVRTQALLERVRARNLGINKYHISRVIGRGSMGQVLKVWDQDLQRFVALKLIKSGLARALKDSNEQASKKALVRFVEEAQVTAQLDHPNIVPVHDFGITRDGLTFFTMKLVKGQDLSNIIRYVHSGANDWTITRALGVLLKACEALSYAHDKGVVHRDLKPANIMVGKFGAVYVVDWGLARISDAPDENELPVSGELTVRIQSSRHQDEDKPQNDPLLTQDGMSVGTPLYMPPEQARGSRAEVGPQSDVYGMGAILYHVLAGVPPYYSASERLSAGDVLLRILEGPPRSLDEVAPDVPQELRAIVSKAMAHSLSDRYTSMAELSNDLLAFIEGRVVGAWRPSRAQGVEKWVRRHRGLVATVALCALLLLWSPLSRSRGEAAENGRTRTESRQAAAQILGDALDEPLSAECRRAAQTLARILERSDATESELQAALSGLQSSLGRGK